jgi:hypothetical protein
MLVWKHLENYHMEGWHRNGRIHLSQFSKLSSC